MWMVLLFCLSTRAQSTLPTLDDVYNNMPEKGSITNYEKTNDALRISNSTKDYNLATPDNNLLDLNSAGNALPEPAALAAPERSIYDSGYTNCLLYTSDAADE